MARLRGNRVLRFFDRYAGVPAVAALSLRGKRGAPADPKRIGLMKSVAIGDLVLMSGVVEDVRSKFPRAQLVLITGDDNAALGRLLLREGDQQISVSPFHVLESVRAVRRQNLDALLDFGAWPRFDAMVSALSGANFTAGFNTPGQSRHLAYDRSVSYSSSIHEVENNRNLARVLGVESKSMPRLAAPGIVPDDRFPAMSYVVFHPWAGGFKYHVREWPSDRWVELGKQVSARGFPIVITGGKGDAARSVALAAAIAATGARVTDTAGQLPLPELVDVLARAATAVCVNTGVMHIAAALGTRTIGLQGPTSSVRWGPLGRAAVAVDSRTPGCGYLNLGWEYDGQRLDCMDGITVADVGAAIDRVMSAS